jgi:hypothetical protein
MALFPEGATEQPIPVPPDLVGQFTDVYDPTGRASRLTDLLTACRAHHAAEAIHGSADLARMPAPSGPGGPTASLNLASQDGVAESDLLLQLAALLAWHPATHLEQRPGLDAIAEDLAAGLPPGPADTTAYYDFHRLQCAWENTWTSALDGMTVAAASDLYEALVDTIDPGVLWIDNSEIAELDDLLEGVAQAIGVSTSTSGLDPPADLITWLPALAGVWQSLSLDDQEWIRFLAWIDDFVYPFAITPLIDLTLTVADIWLGTEWPQEWLAGVQLSDVAEDEDWGRNQAEEFLEGLDLEAAAPAGLSRLEGLLGGLNERLAEPYSFDIFVPGSYNFGILSTYRQRWRPLGYQAGDLVASIPLSPGETRDFETKRIVKTSRTQKEIEHSLALRSGESTTIGRAEAEIVQKASNATNFAMTAQGAINVAIANVGASNEFGADQSADSAETKRDFREATVRAAQEYRDERTLEIATEDVVTGETVERRSISNPNNEITVTYLLYELQRRFEVSEQLHEIRPVVLVAFDVPSPDEIDEAWLIANAWILRRVILDDRLLPALDYLSDAFAGDELSVAIVQAQWDAQMAAVGALSDNVETSMSVRNVARAALAVAAASVAGGDGLIKNLGEILFPATSGPDSDDVLTAQRESAQQGLEWADADLLAQRTRLEGGVSALQQATVAYVEAVKHRTNRRVAIDQLRVHVKENVLHYMQAIWSHEPPDQRYFRLYDLAIEWPESDPAAFLMALEDSNPASGVGVAMQTSMTAVPMAPGVLTADVPSELIDLLVPPPSLGPERRLHEVADVDSLLGFKGNYAMFPLREGNAITDYMEQDCLDSYFGIIDPDPFGEIPTTTQAIALAECAWDRPDTTDADRAEITQWLVAVMAAQKRIAEEIVVPTGQLFMEALPGAHPLLEDFKLQHRALDVERAVVDLKVRQMELLRRAARLVKGDLSDPDIEQRVEITGSPSAVGVNLSPPVGEPA